MAGKAILTPGNSGGQACLQAEPVKDTTKKYMKRDRICALEIWNECFGRDPGSLKRFNTKEINDILANNPAWERGKKAIRFGEYGVQKGFKKKDDIKK